MASHLEPVLCTRRLHKDGTQHQGISKTKSLVREKVWWPFIDCDVKSMTASSHFCQITAPLSLNHQPLQMSEITYTYNEKTRSVQDISVPFERLYR